MPLFLNLLGVLFLFCGVQIVIGLLVPLIWHSLTGASDITSTQLIVTSAATSVITIAALVALGWSRPSKRYIRMRPWGVLFWASLAAVGAVIPSTRLQELLPPLPNVLTLQLTSMLRHPWGFFAVGLLAPVAEEMVFRGALLRMMLTRLGPWTAITISAAAFALCHFNPAQMPHALIMGLLLGWMYYRTGSIVPGLALHFVNNAVAYTLCNILPDPDIPLILLLGSQKAVMMAVFSSLCILLPSIYQLHLRMKSE